MSNEWYTPAHYVDAAREVMGSIELDPASCELANRTVQATRYYSVEDNGLSKPWVAESVWLNPPYSETTKWIRKILTEYRNGSVSQAIILVRSFTDTQWFQSLLYYPICFVHGRMSFYASQAIDDYNQSRFGNVFVYLGSNEQKFIDVFRQFGPVIPSRVIVRKSG